MSDYCLQIQFNSPFLLKDKEVDTFHAHFVSENDDLELRLFFDPSEYVFEHLFDNWLKAINWSNLGTYFEVLSINHETLKGIDFSESNVIGSQTGSNQYKNNEKFISIKLDWVKFIWESNTDTLYTAEFYLNDNAYELVSEYYSVLWQNNDTSFSFGRMKDVGDSYKINDIIFNPKFNFYSKDSRSNSISTIHKEPKIQISFPKDKEISQIINTFRLIALASSFYFRRNIDFTTARVHLNDFTIVIRRKLNDRLKQEKTGTLWPVYNKHNIDDFFNQVKTSNIDSDSLNKLEIIVRKFIQAELVDIRSSILLRFAILEVCKGSAKDEKPEKFDFIENGKILTKKKRNEVLVAARDLIAEKLKEDEKQAFIDKWTSSIAKITLKPMRSPFEKYLESIGFNLSDLPLNFSTVKEIRDSITHGSTGKYTEDELLKCNWTLYRISVGLILSQLEVENWIEDLKLKAD